MTKDYNGEFMLLFAPSLTLAIIREDKKAVAPSSYHTPLMGL